MSVELSAALADDLSQAVSGSIRFDVPLSEESRWRIGGRALAIAEANSPAEAARVMRLMRDEDLPLVVIGDTSNILFDSAGFHGVLLKIGPRMSRFAIEGTRVWAEAGISVPALARSVAEAGLTGMEHASGVPGTLGGLVLMNGGSQRKGIGSVLTSALCSDMDGRLFTLTREDFGFAYRSSSLQGRQVAILEAELELVADSPATVIAAVEAVLAERRDKFPLDLPNCGSTFLSDPAMYSVIGPPGRAIEEAGLKGVRHGGAQISELHANFIVNVANARDDDVLWLISLIRRTVAERTGFTMNCEVRHLSAAGQLRPAHETATERWPNATRDVEN